MKPLIATALFSLFATLSSGAGAAEVPFNQAQFESVLAAGEPVAVVFHANWCPTCRAQSPILKKLVQMPPLTVLTLFVADFDTEKALKKSLGVTKQSTIVVFKKGKEVARSTGDTQDNRLSLLLRSAIS